MDKLNKRELIQKLTEDWCAEINFLTPEEKENLIKLSVKLYRTDYKVLYNIYEVIMKNEDKYENEIISLDKTNGRYTLKFMNKAIGEFELDNIKKIIIGLIDILEDILPLGSVVRIKKEYLSRMLQGEEVENVDIVIVNRFIFHNGSNIYVPYAGIPYPTGFVGNANGILFTPSLIEKVLHKGYKDDQDAAYSYLVKNELIVEKKMHSLGFANDEEVEKFNELSKGE